MKSRHSSHKWRYKTKCSYDFGVYKPIKRHLLKNKAENCSCIFMCMGQVLETYLCTKNGISYNPKTLHTSLLIWVHLVFPKTFSGAGVTIV